MGLRTMKNSNETFKVEKNSICKPPMDLCHSTNEKNLLPLKSVEGWVIIATGIYQTLEEDMYELFADFGVLKNLHMNLDRRTGFAKGYILLEYENKSHAERAINEMDGKELFGTTIRV